MTLWFLIAGRAPESGSSAEIAASRLNRESYAARLPSNLPPPFRDVLGRLLEKDRKNRFATAADVFKAFNACAAALGFRRARDYTDPAAALESEDAEATESDALDFTKLEPAELQPVEAELTSEFNILARINEDFTGLNYVAEEVGKKGAMSMLHVLHRLLLEDGPALERFRVHIAQLMRVEVAEIVRPKAIKRYSDYVTVISDKPEGTDLLSVLRTEGTVSLINAAPLLEKIADACDRLCAAGVPGAQLAPGRIFVESADDGLSKAQPRLWPRFLAVSEATELARMNEPEDTRSTMTTDMLGDPGRADNMGEHFASLLYRVVAGRNCPVAASLSSQAYVAVPGLSEPSNRILSMVIARQVEDSSCGKVLREILDAEGIVPRVPGHSSAGFTARPGSSTVSPLAPPTAPVHSTPPAVPRPATSSGKRPRRNSLLAIGVAAACLSVATAAIFLRQLNQSKPSVVPNASSRLTQAPAEKPPARAWLGIRMQTVGEKGVPRRVFKGLDKGVAVLSIDHGAPAASSGLRPFDAITAINGAPVDNFAEFTHQMSDKKPGDKVQLTVWRKGEVLTVPVTTGEMPKVEVMLSNAREAEQRSDAKSAIKIYREAADQGDPEAQTAYGNLFYEGKLVTQDFVKSAELFRKASDQGNASASFALGVQYEQGKGVAQDYLRAAELFQKAVDQDHAWAEAELGWLYVTGKGLSQDFPKGIELLRRAVDQQSPYAMITLAWCYQSGRGVPQDLSKAMELYQKAVDEGSADAQAALGNLYITGKGVSQDFVKAADLLQKAIDGGSFRAYFDLGYLYAEGKGVPQNLSRAAELWQKAADKDHPVAQNNLGVLYRDGKDVPQNYAKAAQLFQKAADHGYAPAQNNLGVLYGTGNGVEKDLTKAAELYRKAADQGEPYAQRNLATLYQNGTGVPQDLTKAIELYQKAADQEDPNAQAALGYLYYAGQGVPRDYTKAIELLQKAADRNIPSAQTMLGFMYSKGYGVARNYKEAVELYQKAANQGFAHAQYNLGCSYDRGEGVPKDHSRALELYRQAADQGDPDAKKVLAHLTNRR